MTTKDPCVFCEIVAGRAPADVVREWDDALAFVPLDPVAPGHVLVVPRTHVPDISTSGYVAGRTMFHASELAREFGEPLNLITSLGREATQTIFHLHLHLVPRREGDGLALPWDHDRHGDAGPCITSHCVDGQHVIALDDQP